MTPLILGITDPGDQLGEASPVGVIETQAPPFQLPLRNSILFAQGRNHVLLLALQPAAQRRHHELKRKHRRSPRQRRDPRWDTTGSVTTSKYGGRQLYVGTVPNCNQGEVTTNSRHKNCDTREIGYTYQKR